MSQERPGGGIRRQRSDKARNRANLIAAAKRAFAEKGAQASLESIAREAGVGIGTLYRNFPTRDALIEAVYHQEVETLVTASTALLAENDPMTALRKWLLMFVEFIDTKKGMSDALATLIAGPDALYKGSTVRLASSIEQLVNEAARSGALRIEVEPLDLIRAVGGVASVSPGANWKQSAVLMVDLLLKGSAADGCPRVSEPSRARAGSARTRA